MNLADVEVAGTGFTVLDKVYQSQAPALQTLGGSCGNVLVSLAMLDRTVCPVLALGEDSVGDQLVNEFAEAGADTRYIFRRSGIASPVLVQHLDPDAGQHAFSFICPETEQELPRFRSIDRSDVRNAEVIFNTCMLFYTDRLSIAILEAMETAVRSGAIVYFEPSSIDDQTLFAQALRLASIVKFSITQLEEPITKFKLQPGAVIVATKGAEGLEVIREGRAIECIAIPAPIVRDTCGSGDMVTIGIIDRILSRRVSTAEPPALDDVLEGVFAGQRLAAANCAYVGARGIFRQQGAGFVRRILDGTIPYSSGLQHSFRF